MKLVVCVAFVFVVVHWRPEARRSPLRISRFSRVTLNFEGQSAMEGMLYSVCPPICSFLSGLKVVFSMEIQWRPPQYKWQCVNGRVDHLPNHLVLRRGHQSQQKSTSEINGKIPNKLQSLDYRDSCFLDVRPQNVDKLWRTRKWHFRSDFCFEQN